MLRFSNFKVLVIALIATNLFACKKDTTPIISWKKKHN